MSLLAPSVVSLFSGCGGLDLGFKDAGYQPMWANDIAVDACETYNQFVAPHAIVGDIWELVDQVPKADIVIGGPPCQAFSLVGKRLEDDPRAHLVFAFSRIVERIRPRAFVMENVPGLAASKVEGVRLPKVLAERFTKQGYDIEIIKLKAVDFFVPQRRERIVMIGVKSKKNLTSLSFLSSEMFAKILGEPDLHLPVTAREALDDLPIPKNPKSFEMLKYRTDPKSAYARIMRRDGRQKVSLQVMPTMSEKDSEYVRHIPPGGNYTNIPDSVATKRIMKFKETGGRTTTYGRLHPDQPAYTINTYFNRPNVGTNYHYDQARLITPREALRLQSFPDFFDPRFTSQRSLHMQIGNAVPPLMARAIAEALKGLIGC